VVRADTNAPGKPGSPHAVTVRTPDTRLVGYAPIGSRSKTAIAGLGVLDGYAGYLVKNERDQLAPQLLACVRARYDHAVTWGITTNRHRHWPQGNHPGYTLAQRLHDKADQVFAFTHNLAVPWTNDSSEQALKAPNDIKPSPATGTPSPPSPHTAAGACNHGVRPLNAIHTALTGNPWLPTISAA
jgi:hypothetical protein